VRVVVTGGAGFLAGRLSEALVAAGNECIAPAHPDLDVTDADAVLGALEGFDAVVHTAYRPVRVDSVVQARLVNVHGAGVVAAASARLGLRMVHISSDVVFPGDGRTRSEEDPPSPLRGFAYGEQKAEAEESVRANAPDATVVRTSLMWDHRGRGSLSAMVRGSAVPGSPMRHFVDEYRCPVHVDDVAAGIVRILEDPEPPPVVHLVGPERVDRHRIALRLAIALEVDPAALSAAEATSHPGTRPRDLMLSCALARDRYGWVPRPLPPMP
jgi:dTDP-4-dehydrorhamnose reductase